MRAAWGLMLAVSIVSSAGAASVDPAEVWRPLHAFIGTWKGTRAGGNGAIRVTRIYASAPTNHHLEITEKDAGRSPAAVRGMISFDPERQRLVLRSFAADGSTSDLALDAESSTDARVVFVTGESDPRLRITYERLGERPGSKVFVERVERATGGQPFVGVSETRFVRAD